MDRKGSVSWGSSEGHILPQAVYPRGPSISPVTPTPDALLKLHLPPTMALSYRWNPELPFPSGNPPLLTALTVKYQLSLAEKHLPQAWAHQNATFSRPLWVLQEVPGSNSAPWDWETGSALPYEVGNWCSHRTTTGGKPIWTWDYSIKIQSPAPRNGSWWHEWSLELQLQPNLLSGIFS